MKDYNEWLAGKIRMVCFTAILLSGSLHMEFKSAGPTILYLITIVMGSEAVAAGIAAKYLADFPIFVGLTLGFVLCSAAPAIVVPSLMKL